MNTETPKIHETKNIDIDKIFPSPANPRNFTTNKQEIETLSKSIKAQGLLHPIIVRPLVTPIGQSLNTYEIITGERRYRACKLIWNQIPAIIRKNLTDTQAHEITVTENLQREDLTPLEEAKGIDTLLKSGKETTEIADKLGKPVTWVTKRAKLTDLSDLWIKKINNPEHPVSKWTATHLELIARFDKNLQDDILETSYFDPCLPVKELKESLNRYLLKLKSAPWNIETDFLGTRVCSRCIKRSSHQPHLFDTEKIETGDDKCLDRKCWGKKLNTYIEVKEKYLRKEHKNLILFNNSSGTNGHTLPAGTKLSERTEQQWKYAPAKKTGAESIPALIIDGPGAGNVKWVKLDNRYLTPSTPKYDKNGEKLPTSLHERRKKLEKRRALKFIESVIKIINSEYIEPNLIKLLSEKIILLAATSFETQGYIHTTEERCIEDWELFHKLDREYTKENKPDILIKLMQTVIPGWRKNLNSVINLNAAEPSLEYAEKICVWIGINSNKIKTKIRDEIKEPKI